jgi:hypothetical protein
MGLSPTVKLVLELLYLPSIAKCFEPKSSGLKFNNRIFFGNARTATALLVEPFDHLLAEESRIGPESDAKSGDGFENFG